MRVVDVCGYPTLAASTAYGKGCRCDRCRAAHSDRYRRYYEANRHERTETNRRWRDQNTATLAAYNQRWRQDNLQRVTQREQQRRHAMRDQAPAAVTGRYDAAEDRVIVSWSGSELALAQALGRTWESVRGRKRELRKAGLLDRPTRRATT